MIASRLITRTASRVAAARSVARYTTYSQLPEEHRMIYDMCSNFADEELVPHAGEWDKKHEYPTNAIAQLVCITYPCF